jgi:hypothetical protein
MPSLQDYHGWDVHSYTELLQQILPELHISNDKFPSDQFNSLLGEIEQKYGRSIMPCMNNIMNSYYKDERISDPDLPNINFCYILNDLYLNSADVGVKLDDNLLKETLEEIGGTCLQGLTHRLTLLYLYKIQFDITKFQNDINLDINAESNDTNEMEKYNC